MYIITSKTKTKIRRDPKFQVAIRQEKQQFLREKGIEHAIPMKASNQNLSVEDSLKELKKAGGKLQESILETKEQQKKERAAKQREHFAKVAKNAPAIYKKQQEDKARNGKI